MKRKTTHNLDGIWDFAWLGETRDPADVEPRDVTYSDSLSVPSAFDAFPAYAGKRGTAVYRTSVSVTPGSHGLLEFAGTGMWNRVFVDGNHVGDIALPYSGVTLEITPSETRTREIVVVSDNRFSKERVPLQEQYFDFYAYGGLFRSVRWHEVGQWWIDRAAVSTQDLEERILSCKVVLNRAEEINVSDVQCSVGGRSCEISDFAASGAELRFTFAGDSSLDLWSPNHPALHELEISIADRTIKERIGIRTVETAGRQILVNGDPVKLLGYCRHEAHPQYGPALPLQQLVQDIQLLKDQGCNFVRGSHYPQDQRFLDLCDQAGILVFEESLGWQQDESHFANSSYCDDCEYQTRLMVRNSYNHPSVVMWGFLNEGKSHLPESLPLYARLAEAIREEDPTRPVTYASNHPTEDLNFDLADIICVNNYPGWYARDTEALRPLQEIIPALTAIRSYIHSNPEHTGKPLIISEIGAGAIYGWRDDLAAHWSEEYQADYLEIVCDEVIGNKDLAGVALWQFCDARTYSSAIALKRPRAFNNKGVLNEYRKPKLAYRVVKGRFHGAK